MTKIHACVDTCIDTNGLPGRLEPTTGAVHGNHLVTKPPYDKLAADYLAFIRLASIRIWLHAYAPNPQIGKRREVLALRHRDIHASDLALGADLHGLAVAAGPQGQVGGKPRGLDEYFDLAAAGCALQVAENIPARLAPVAGDAVALAGHIAAQVELVAVAGAMQILLQAQSAAVDLVIGLASDALGRSVGKRNGSVAGPRSVETDKWTRLGVARRDRQHQCGADASSRDSLSKQTGTKQTGTKQFHIAFSHSN